MLSRSMFSAALKVLGGAFIGTFAWEHTARINNWAVRPSAGLTWAAEKAVLGFTTLGVWIARLSSFYTYLHVHEVFHTLGALIKPVWRLTTSPFWIIKGYVERISMNDVYEHPYLVVLGTLTIVGVTAYFLRGYLPDFRTWMPNYIEVATRKQ